MSFTHALQTAKPGQPVITLELSPPRGSDTTAFLNRAEKVKGLVHAINVPDCQRALLRMSSLAAATLLEQKVGVETVLQLTTRDRNVLALQADLLGASAFGLRTVLALTGDPVGAGDHKGCAKQVSDIEALGLLRLLNQLNQGQAANGDMLKHQGTHFLKGAALNPAALKSGGQLRRLRQKLELGVDFFQTQPIYAREPVERTLETVSKAAADVGTTVPTILWGLVPPRHADAARFFNKVIPGIYVPQSLISRLETAKQPALESIAWHGELAYELADIATGFHLMPVLMEAKSCLFVEAVANGAARTEVSLSE